MAELRPKQIVKEIGRRWPNVWQQVKSFRANDFRDWPDWCYIPIAAGVAIATQGHDELLYPAIMDKQLNPAVITAAAAWRVSQGVYRFDADLYNALITQPLDDNLPCDVLKRLPEWCVYIDVLPGMTFNGKPHSGFWAHMEYDGNIQREELRLILMLNNNENIPVPIHLGDWTLEEGLQRMQAESEKQMQKLVPDFRFPPINYTRDIEPLVQLVLYLCSNNIDMPRVPAHPTHRVRMSGQVDVPREERYWTVGERIGSAIRKYRNEESIEMEKEYRPDSIHARRRPHIRRAHWATYWTGPRSGKQTPIIKWILPIPINVDDKEEGPSVIHRVTGNQ